jgi:uncharacterized protein (TIGR02266 family)
MALYGLYRTRAFGDGATTNPLQHARSDQVSQTFRQQRAEARFEIELDVSLGESQNFYCGLSENLSTSGVFVATHLVRRIGERIAFSIYLPERDEPVRGIGEVRWARNYAESSETPPGIGLHFVALEPADREALTRFLAEHKSRLYDEL